MSATPTRSCRRRRGLGFAVILLILLGDQATKAWALATWFFPPTRIEITPFFNLVAVWNRGVSFGLFADSALIMPWLLSGLAALIVAAMLVWMWQSDRAAITICAGLIIGGAIGNIVDRMRFGAVVDFLDFHLAGFHWPAFNLADAAITIGVGLLVFDTLTHKADTHRADTRKADTRKDSNEG